MVVGDCLRVDKNDTALGGSIFLNNVVAKKFLQLVIILNSRRMIWQLLRRSTF
ncbi:hypothetical protein [Microcoleus sp. F4-D5]|uniref:hypothetical protein n=1 Tax=Microcoleus sp. F4-D5 TaxID=2818760 RepID=UPI002FD74E14